MQNPKALLRGGSRLPLLLPLLLPLILPLGIGILLALVLTAANLYLGLYAGMTVSASIPAAVLGLALYRALGKRDVHGVNLVQTLASSGESLAAGALFTVPAMVLAGVWLRFEFWPTFLMAASGGLLGILLMVPLRRKLMEDARLRFPEGVACAEVLRAGMGSDLSEASQASTSPISLRDLLWGSLLGAGVKFITGMGWIAATLEGAWRTGRGVFYLGGDLSPALLAVGYLTGMRVALQVFAGGLLAWGLLPWVAHLLPGSSADAGVAAALAPLEIAWGSWSKHLRYLGAGAMVVAGLWSLFEMLPMVFNILRGAIKAVKRGDEANAPSNASQDLQGPLWWGLFALAMAGVLGLYLHVLDHVGLAVFATALAAIACLLWVAVSSHIVGLVGSSNNPVSGMTLSALLGTAFLLVLLGFEGHAGVMATLGVAAVVCCAACAAADCSQDLKTGYLLGTSPRRQQIFEVVGAILPALIIAPVLNVLHQVYGIGDGLKAPQATLFASLTQGVFGKGHLPLPWMLAGMGMGLLLVLAAIITKSKHRHAQVTGKKGQTGVEIYPMAVAVGMYLPFSLTLPIALGGLAHWFLSRKQKPDRTLFASGLVAGEALTGVALALIVYFGAR